MEASTGITVSTDTTSTIIAPGSPPCSRSTAIIPTIRRSTGTRLRPIGTTARALGRTTRTSRAAPRRGNPCPPRDASTAKNEGATRGHASVISNGDEREDQSYAVAKRVSRRNGDAQYHRASGRVEPDEVGSRRDDTVRGDLRPPQRRDHAPGASSRAPSGADTRHDVGTGPLRAGPGNRRSCFGARALGAPALR